MKFILSLSIMLCAVLTACHSKHSSTKKSNSNSFSSIQTGKTDMSTKSPMLNEILTTKVETKEIPAGQFMPGQPRDVSSIVSKYIPIGISREKAKQILVNMNQHFEEEGNIIHAGYLAEFIPMVPRAGVVIKLTFNKLNFLETIDAHLSYQQ